MSTVNRQLRILVAKPGLDGHDRGAKIIARALRDAGIEVIYTGLHQTPEMIVATAIQEDVDAIGLSILSGAHMTIFPAVIDLLAAQKAPDIQVFGGGIIPQDDVPKLKAKGGRRALPPRHLDADHHRVDPRQREAAGRGGLTAASRRVDWRGPQGAPLVAFRGSVSRRSAADCLTLPIPQPPVPTIGSSVVPAAPI